MKNKILKLIFLAFLIGSCSDDELSDDNSGERITLSENVLVYNKGLLSDNLILNVQLGKKYSTLINKQGKEIKRWEFDKPLGMELKILPNTNLLGAFQVENKEYDFGGGGGIFKILDFEGEEQWSFTYANKNHLSHHDVKYLPNGNILFAAWERLTKEDALRLGVNTNIDLYPETVIEINPNSNNIVWKWNSADHTIQDTNSEIIETYGNISENPQKINFNYKLEGNEPNISNGNIMHCNGLFYDKERDVIYLSILQYGEVWVIDHSTTTTQAATSNGGNYGKGGDLIYRFGNPSAYKGSGDRIFYRTHTPTIIPENYPGGGNFMIFMNGDQNHPISKVYEFKLPEVFSFQNTSPQLEWSYSNSNLYFDKVSSAVRLPNGNTLIGEGDFGIWEVTPDGEVVWKYENKTGNIWRAYGYEKDSPELKYLIN